MDLPFAVSDPAPIQPTVLLHNDDTSAAASSTFNNPSGPVLQRTSAHPHTMLSQPNGGILYNNLIPGHYRYGAKPPEPPPGPLSVDSSHSYTNVQNRQSQSSIHQQVLQVSEPDEEDDDLFVIALEEDDDDDEKLYRPFRHSASNGSVHTKSDRSVSSASTNSKKSKSKAKGTRHVETKPKDLLTVLLGGSVHDDSTMNRSTDQDMSMLIEEATTLSRKARSMTTALAAKNDAQSAGKKDNGLYVETANAHTEAALAFRKVYRSLLGIDDDNFTLNAQKLSGLAPSEELAKSMLILANGHVRMAASLGDMGVKWNMGKADSFGMVCHKSQSASKAAALGGETQTAPNNENKQIPQHERIRLAVRGALDTANHEADITNSTFLARSTFLNAKPAASKPNTGGKAGSGHVYKDNPVDDLMKLEKELKGMDMALEVGTSVSNLGAAVSSRPDGSFCVVPPGSSYMSSSFMWSSGIMGKVGGNQQQQNRQGDKVGLTSHTGVRSRANHLQNFLGGSKPPVNPHTAPPKAPALTNPAQTTTKPDQSSNNAGLDQSWWGGGQGSMMASVALSTVASHQKPPAQHNARPVSPRAEPANTKQLMQLMDALKRLGDENAQLMREVEEAKAARSEAASAKNMMEKFKKEYSQRFAKVKEALEKYPRNAPDNPVNNSAYMKSASTAELQKRDQMIKSLAADLRKEREDSKKKDTALRKYEGFYREVKARSAEKARQRQLQEEQKKKAEHPNQT